MFFYSHWAFRVVGRDRADKADTPREVSAYEVEGIRDEIIAQFGVARSQEVEINDSLGSSSVSSNNEFSDQVESESDFFPIWKLAPFEGSSTSSSKKSKNSKKDRVRSSGDVAHDEVNHDTALKKRKKQDSLYRENDSDDIEGIGSDTMYSADHRSKFVAPFSWTPSKSKESVVSVSSSSPQPSFPQYTDCYEDICRKYHEEMERYQNFPRGEEGKSIRSGDKFVWFPEPLHPYETSADQHPSLLDLKNTHRSLLSFIADESR